MTGIDRRTLIGSAAAFGLLAHVSRADAQSLPLPQGFTRMPIWPGKAPGSDGVSVIEAEKLRRPGGPADDTFFEHIVTPTLTVLRPKKPNGAAMLLFPGGGYIRIAIGHEGYEIARRLAAAGYTCFILLYRLPGDGWAGGPDAPLQDAQRALRTVKSLAAQYRFDPARVGVMGFSAGGHLAAWLAIHGAKDAYEPVDAIDQQPLGVRAAALMYPVIQMDGVSVHAGSRRQLLGPDPTPAQLKAYSMEIDVARDAPPTFLAHAADDTAVPVENSLAVVAALRERKIPVECHIFESGGHGFGLAPANAAVSDWPDLFLAFAKRHGL